MWTMSVSVMLLVAMLLFRWVAKDLITHWYKCKRTYEADKGRDIRGEDLEEVLDIS